MKKQAVEVAESIEQLYFDVRKEKCFTQSGLETDRVALVREDNNKVLGVVSSAYKLVKNRPLFEPLIDKMKELDHEVKIERISSIKNGARSFVEFVFPSLAAEVRVNDILKFKITGINSFDGSHRLVMRAGAHRLVCLNGATIVERESSLSKRHIGDQVDIKALVGSVQESLIDFKNTAELYKKLDEIAKTREEGSKEIEEISKQYNVSERWMKLAKDRWEAQYDSMRIPPTMWGVYNAFTEQLTHGTENPERKVWMGDIFASHFERLVS